MFINSKTGYEGDLVLDDSEIPCLPESPTGQSVISCSMIVRASQKNLRLFEAERTGAISVEVAKKLKAFVETPVNSLTRPERELVLAALNKLIPT